MGKVREFEQHATDKGNQSPVKEAVRFGEEIRISLDFQRGKMRSEQELTRKMAQDEVG